MIDCLYQSGPLVLLRLQDWMRTLSPRSSVRGNLNNTTQHNTLAGWLAGWLAGCIVTFETYSTAVYGQEESINTKKDTRSPFITIGRLYRHITRGDCYTGLCEHNFPKDRGHITCMWWCAKKQAVDPILSRTFWRICFAT
jgi:hypothetical protein